MKTKKMFIKNKIFFYITFSFLLILSLFLTHEVLSENSFFKKTGKKDKNKIKIVTTTTMIYDVIQKMVDGIAINNQKDSVFQVECLMGVGVDPHNYKPRLSDRLNIKEADLVIMNGLHLEAKMIDSFEEIISKEKIFEIGSDIKNKNFRNKLILDDATKAPDPHIWFDMNIWKIVIDELFKRICYMIQEQDISIKNQLIGNMKEDILIQIKKNKENYEHSFEQLRSYVKQCLNKGLKEDKEYYLVTGHDAFSYFVSFLNDLFEDQDSFPHRKITLKSIQGISTQMETSMKDIEELANAIIYSNEKNNCKPVKFIFTETSISDKNIKSLQDIIRRKSQQNKEYRVDVVDAKESLFSDSLNEDVNYIATFKHNIKIIVDKLK